MNLLLVDVREDYTAFVPAREPKPGSKRQERRPQGAPSSKPLQEPGVGVEEEGKGSQGKPPDIGVARPAPGLRAAVRGEGGKGGWGGGGGVSWGGGGSVSWGGGGDGGVEEVKGLSYAHCVTTPDAHREGALGTQELEAGGGGSGGDDRGAVAPSAGFTGARAEFPSAGARIEAASPHPGETRRVAETTSGPGNSQSAGPYLAEKGQISDNEQQGAGRFVRIGEAQRPPGEGGGSDSKGVGGQEQQGSCGQPPPDGRGSGLQEEGGASGQTEAKKKKSTRRSRGRGPWTGELVPVRRRRFLKQLMIRGDNVVMIWECPNR